MKKARLTIAAIVLSFIVTILASLFGATQLQSLGVGMTVAWVTWFYALVHDAID